MLPRRPFQRNRYLTGRLLSAEDFQREQDYVVNKGRLHNRYLHGWGVVDGLRVSADGNSVVVTPGLAIDCQGNDVLLPEPVRLTWSRKAGRCFVTIRYAETPTGATPSPGGSTEPAIIREDALVEICSSNPLHRHARPGMPGCGTPHAIALATLGLRQGRRSVAALRVRLPR
ncbi:MAG: hypothetical protein R2712_05915 [Vicinamibacterales bacterium]